jgi:hypothetical protein
MCMDGWMNGCMHVYVHIPNKMHDIVRTDTADVLAYAMPSRVKSLVWGFGGAVLGRTGDLPYAEDGA